MKAIEMLFTDAPIVTDIQGTCGMPTEIKQLFRVASTAEDFAAEILVALDEVGSLNADRIAARQKFGLRGLAAALSEAGPLIGFSKRAIGEDVNYAK